MNELINEYKKKFNPVVVVILALLTIFMAYYPYRVRMKIINEYEKGIRKSLNKLKKQEEKEQAQEMLRTLEKGQFIPANEHDTSDFMHTSYFDKPWRRWESTAYAWEMARNMYFVFLAFLILQVPLGNALDWLFLKTAREKMAGGGIYKILDKFNSLAKKQEKKREETEKADPRKARTTLFKIPGFKLLSNWKISVATIIVLLAVVIHISLGLSAKRSKYFPTNLDRPVAMQLFTEMIGEMRTILASYIFIRADMYHHEREDKISWTKDPVTLPLHRMVTALDPKFIQAYDFGAWHLAVNLKKYREAIKFLQEGLRYNPKSWQLYFTMGDIYYFKEDYKASTKYYKKALNLADHQAAVLNCLRRLYWANRKIKDYEKAGEYLMMLYKIDPNSPVLKRLDNELYKLKTGQMTEEEYEKRRKKARDEKKRRIIEKKLEQQLHPGHDHHHHDHKGHDHNGRKHEDQRHHDRKHLDHDDHDHKSHRH